MIKKIENQLVTFNGKEKLTVDEFYSVLKVQVGLILSPSPGFNLYTSINRLKGTITLQLFNFVCISDIVLTDTFFSVQARLHQERYKKSGCRSPYGQEL